jgi:hypothetical protein
VSMLIKEIMHVKGFAVILKGLYNAQSDIVALPEYVLCSHP